MTNFTNHYRCPCGEEWDDLWDCACNDRCPSCDKEIEPYESEEHPQIDPEMTQEPCMTFAETAMEAHAEVTGVDYERSQEALTDMLTNLRHYADVHSLRFFAALESSYTHYLAEKQALS